MNRVLAMCVSLLMALPASALVLDVPFESIDGGALSLSEWHGQPILIVNTASQCGFTNQYRGLQDLYDRYRDRGLIVLAIPSDDFRQELSSNDEVKEFCELQYGIDLPMTEITHIRGSRAHPFYKSIREETGFVPKWNFSKILIGPDGEIVETYGSRVKPLSSSVTRKIEVLLK